MTKSEIFKAAHKAARYTVRIVGSYSIALQIALKEIYAFIKKPLKTLSGKKITIDGNKITVETLGEMTTDFSVTRYNNHHWNFKCKNPNDDKNTYLVPVEEVDYWFIKKGIITTPAEVAVNRRLRAYNEAMTNLQTEGHGGQW